MRAASSTPAIGVLCSMALIGVLSACATARNGQPAGRVELIKPFETASTEELSPLLSIKLARLAEIDPEHPLADKSDGQTLSLFGREDLIAATSDDFRPKHCAPLTSAVDVMDEIERRARQTSIVIINESHERSQHRGFSAQVASRLRPLGYDTMAIETLSNAPPGTPTRYLPPVLQQPDLPFLEDGDGYYLSEAGFGRLGRRAKALGFRLLPYEDHENDGLPANATVNQRIAIREEGQARTLASYLRDHPGAKLLVHVGYSHATEVPRPDGAKWMAARLKQKTGIDPLTVSQTTCRGNGQTLHLAKLPADEPAGTYDLIVDYPSARFIRGRPEWRKLAGDRAVDIPRSLYPATGWRVIEARPPGEPVASVPMDRVAIRPGEDIALMLPPGRYYLRAIDVARPKQTPSLRSH